MKVMVFYGFGLEIIKNMIRLYPFDNFCWNYSFSPGSFADESLICDRISSFFDRCKEALTGNL
jgi:hypothetical protein